MLFTYCMSVTNGCLFAREIIDMYDYDMIVDMHRLYSAYNIKSKIK